MAEPRTEDRGFRQKPLILDYLGTEGSEAHIARRDAGILVRNARAEISRVTEGSAPSPEEVRERRESRRLREAYQEV